jgi:energy-converting hydrogenase Eha subunit A
MNTNKQVGIRKVDFNQKVQRVWPGALSGVGTTLLLLLLLWPGGQCFAQQVAGAQAYVLNGFVYNVAVTNGGSGYSVPPTVSFSGGGGSGAVAGAAITSTGTVSTITISNAGTGYTSAPIVVIEPPVFDLNDTLVGYWPFENNVNDASPYNQTGAVSGGISYPVGAVGNAAAFTGGNYVDFGSPSDGRYDITAAQDCSIALWVKTSMSGTANWPMLLSKDSYCHAVYRDGWEFFFNTGTGTITGVASWGNGNDGGVDTGRPINDNQWHHLVATKRGSQMTMYVDGQLVSTVSGAVGWYPYAVSMRLAGNEGCFSRYVGYVDEFRFYKRALAHREIEALYIKLPVITQPQPAVGVWGGTVTFSTTALGTAPFSYHWSKDGQPIAWGTNAVLTLTNVQAAAAGAYSVMVSNLFGKVYSQPAALTVSVIGTALSLYPGMTINGVVGQTYGVQSSTNLSNPSGWIGLTNITLTSQIQMWFDLQPAKACDCQSVSPPARYYRVVQGPISIP